MTTYTAIPNGDIDQDSPVTQPLLTLLRDNPIAIAESDETGATPVNQALWHPYDMVTTNDGSDGLFYDQAVDGTVASVETPAFSDGYEYRIVGDGLSLSSNEAFTVALYRGTDLAYATGQAVTVAQASAADDAAFVCDIHHATMQSTGHLVTSSYAMSNGNNGVLGAGIYDATLQKITKARVSSATANIDEGKLWLYRRRILGVGG